MTGDTKAAELTSGVGAVVGPNSNEGLKPFQRPESPAARSGADKAGAEEAGVASRGISSGDSRGALERLAGEKQPIPKEVLDILFQISSEGFLQEAYNVFINKVYQDYVRSGKISQKQFESLSEKLAKKD